MKMLTKAMALDLVDCGIHVNALSPGFTDTGLSGRFKATEEGRAFLALLLDRIPMRRPGEPEEMVGDAVFLALDESFYVTGVSLPVDGGYLAK
jgi:meso-butanediol dehydrogenase/(S,S)-butanediol dehydrogenase/diacetyl reductase